MATPVNQQPRRTLGEALAGTDLVTAGALGGLALVVIGSLGPWVTAPLASAAGTNGDGKWTIVLAVIGAVQLVRQRPVGVAIAAVLCGVEGVYQAVHIQSVVSKITLNGVQLDHVGWGVYAVIAGALLTLAMIYRDWRGR
jgi:hypothetical protein